MEVKNLFPHPIAEIKLDVDVDSIVRDAVELCTDNISAGWDCDVISTFGEPEVNRRFAIKQYDFLSQVEKAGQRFLRMVGWQGQYEEYLSHWWINRYQNDHWQEWHHHGKHSVCGIFYCTVDAVPTIFMNPNEYTFHIQHELSDKEKQYRVYPQPGKLVLFPGYMFHTVPYKMKKQGNLEYDQNRVTFAFNFSKSGDRERPLSAFEGGDGKIAN